MIEFILIAVGEQHEDGDRLHIIQMIGVPTSRRERNRILPPVYLFAAEKLARQ